MKTEELKTEELKTEDLTKEYIEPEIYRNLKEPGIYRMFINYRAKNSVRSIIGPYPHGID